MSEAAYEIAMLRGQHYFDALFQSIESAQREIRIETYTLRFDTIGNRTLDLLEGAAKRGVAVCLVADGLGSPEVTHEKERKINGRGIHYLTYRRPSQLGFFQRFHKRLHRKLAVFDRRVLYIGGINIADQYVEAGPDTYADLALRITGDIAEEAARLTEAFFESTRKRRILRWRRLRFFRTLKKKPSSGQVLMELVVRDNSGNRRSIERSYRASFGGAKESILLAHAYFLPSHGIVNDLIRAAQRGVAVTLFVQGRAEHQVLRLAQVLVYHRLHAAGARIHEYHKRLLHTKAAVVDHRWITIGSSNLDPWSIFSNLEANVNIVDAELAAKIERNFMLCAEADCTPFEPERLRMIDRWLAACAYGLVRLAFIATGGYQTRRGPMPEV